MKTPNLLRLATGQLIIFLTMQGVVDFINGQLFPWYPSHSRNFRMPSSMEYQPGRQYFSDSRSSVAARGLLSWRAASYDECEKHDEKPRDCVNKQCFWCCSDQYCHTDLMADTAVDCDPYCAFAINLCTSFATWSSSLGIRFEIDTFVSTGISICSGERDYRSIAGAYTENEKKLFKHHVYYFEHRINIPIHYDGDYELTIVVAETDAGDHGQRRHRNMGALLNKDAKHSVYRNFRETELPLFHVVFKTRRFTVRNGATSMLAWDNTESTISDNKIELFLFSEDYLTNKKDTIQNHYWAKTDAVFVRRIR